MNEAGGVGTAERGSAPGRVGAIDIGTNSVLLTICEPDLTPVVERATITRLGQGVDGTRALNAEACRRTLDCLAEYARLLEQHGAERVDVVGTSAMRDAEGGDAFVRAATNILGVAPRTIGGDEEARLSFEGTLSGLTASGAVLVFDIGGGSTELVCGRVESSGHRVERAVSLNIGSVRLFERHLAGDPPQQRELDELHDAVSGELGATGIDARGRNLIGVAGTVTTIAAMSLGLDRYDGARVHGAELRRDRLRELSTRLASLPVAERRLLPGLEPARADVIVAGAAIALAITEWAEVERVTVSDRGVRWGLIQRLLAPAG